MVFDCFPFNDELDLLEIRLNHHDPFVDKFVLSEATYTYSGQPKELYFAKARSQPRFDKFRDKIIHCIFADPPNGLSNWAYEHKQRDFLREALAGASDDDIILYLDCDEILRDARVLDIAMAMNSVVTMQLKHCWYYLNCVKDPASAFHKDYSLAPCFADGWIMGKVCRKAHLDQFNHLYSMREAFLREENPFIVHDAGWHFSNLGGGDRIYNKLMAFSHSSELNKKYKLSPELIQYRKDKLLDPLGRKGVEFIRTELDVPQFVTNNIDRFQEYILDVPDN